jgi:16S rRNA (guanine1516-N2)-methyltransferase
MNVNWQASVVGIYCQNENYSNTTQSLSETLNLPLIKESPDSILENQFVLLVDEGLSLAFTGRNSPSPIRVDFTEGAAAHRRKFGGGKGQLIAKAIGLKGQYKPHVHDLTAGLGQDAFVLACLGCQMTLIERVPVINALLKDGLERALASGDQELIQVVSAIELKQANAIDYLGNLNESADVIYLDPMFPERSKSAKVNKAMSAFHAIVGSDTDAGALLEVAYSKVKYRVVVKRPRKAPTINEQFSGIDCPEPNLVLSGKSSRYDIYTLAKLPIK